jgi:formylmethanofuran dehydrogenase subunit E
MVRRARVRFSDLQAYQIMPDEVMFTVQPVALNSPVADIVSRPGVRVNRDACGEEIINEREIKDKGLTLCRAYAHGAYYNGYAPAGETLFRGFFVSRNVESHWPDTQTAP